MGMTRGDWPTPPENSGYDLARKRNAGIPVAFFSGQSIRSRAISLAS